MSQKKGWVKFNAIIIDLDRVFISENLGVLLEWG